MGFLRLIILALIANLVVARLNSPEVLAVFPRALQVRQGVRLRRLPGSTTALNDALSTIEFDLELGDIPEVQVTNNIYANVGTSAEVSGFAIGDIAVVGTSLSAQQYEISLQIVNLEFEGETDISFRCTGFFVFFCPSDGTVTLDSEAPNEATQITVAKIVQSTDLSNTLPTEVIDDATCSDIVDLDSVALTVSDVTVLGIDVGGTATDTLNEPENRELALGPLRDTLCDQIINISVAFGELLLSNPLTDLIPDTSLSFDDLVAAAQATVVPTPEQDILNLEDIDPIALLEGIFGNFSSIDGLLDEILDLVGPILGQNASSAVDAIGDLLDSLNITGFLSAGFVIPNVLSLPIDLGEVGSISINVTEVRVAVDLPETVIGGDAEVSQQIFELPTLNLGDISAGVDVQVGMTLNAEDILLPGVSIVLDIFDEFSADATVEGLAAKLAVLFALDLNQLPNALNFQIGSLYSDLVQCLLSLLAVPPQLIAEITATSIGVQFSDVDDVLVFALVDLVQALLDIYGWALPSVLSGFLNGLSDLLLGDYGEGCPAYVEGPDGGDPYDFTQDPVLTTLNAIVDIDLITDATEPFLTILEGLGTITIIDSETDLGSIDIPGTDTALNIRVNSLTVGDLFPLMIDEFQILNPTLTSPYAPQGLDTSVSIVSGAVANAVAQLNVISTIDGSVVSGNLFDASLGLDSESALAVIFASLTNAEVLGRSLSDLVDIPCLIADLDPFGGLKTLDINLGNLQLGFSCQACDSTALVELNATRLEAVKNAILQDIDDITGSAVDLFSATGFSATNAAATAACAGTGSVSDIFAGVITEVTNTLDEWLAILGDL